ncbi:baseplate J/gp47 family protein [Alkalinema pantanalense CENA528]|uniref:baseplate J/gp47 family protein n=1 Tax=Alkalinema pantanalense TaxID=1620705 RepID=UPI003D6FA15E
MAEKDIIQNLIFQLGQSQTDRQSEALDSQFAKVDERSLEDLWQFARQLSSAVNYYRGNIDTPAGDWQSFFPSQGTLQQFLTSETAETPPHLALFLTFLKLYQTPQEVLNQITERHLDFYYKTVLQFQPKPAIPDKAHLVLELKKNTAPVLMTPQHQFSAGKDATGVEQIYVPTRETVINPAKVASLRSLFLDRASQTVRYAPIANSADGLGEKLSTDSPSWSSFGNASLPRAEVGFAIASPVLAMQEGTRTVTVRLNLSNVDRTRVNNTTLVSAFDVFLTGAKTWLGPYRVSPTLSSANVLEFSITIAASDAAVIGYDVATHGYTYTTADPVLQAILNPDATLGYLDWQSVSLLAAQITVEVSGITGLHLESDDGLLDPKRPFLPFGAQPTIGSSFRVGYPEALNKKLLELKLAVKWKGVNPNLATHYSGYGTSVTNASFTAAVAFDDGGTWHYTGTGELLFDRDNATVERVFQFRPGTPSISPALRAGMEVYTFNTIGSLWAFNFVSKYLLWNPVFIPLVNVEPEARSGFITFALERDFLHSTYRTKYVENVMTYSKTGGTLTILNEPYTPTIQTISLSYKAQSDAVAVSSIALSDFANQDVQFFHITYFGQMREHGYQRNQFNLGSTVALLPTYAYAGELLIGLQGLQPGDSVSLLFQVAEGSANPDIARESLDWFVLGDNYWQLLDRSSVVLDTTQQLLTSGITQFIIPANATTQNTILPSNQIWIKAGIRNNVTTVCRLVQVAANAIAVQFQDQGNDPQHLLTPLEPGKISKLKTTVAGIKAIAQPYASFGGRAIEADRVLQTRASERLRHKNRCITAWDYERIVLEAFPQIHQVKCIPHAKDGVWLAPGNVLLVVVPDLRNQNAANPLQPKVDAVTLQQITDYVNDRRGMQVKVQVKNPLYQTIQVDCRVQFYPGYEFNYYQKALKQALTEFLSPWAFNIDRPISFGGKVYKSVLLDFVEELSYIDYVTDFKVYTYSSETNNFIDVSEVSPTRPDAILVSDSSHIINPVV